MRVSFIGESHLSQEFMCPCRGLRFGFSEHVHWSLDHVFDDRHIREKVKMLKHHPDTCAELLLFTFGYRNTFSAALLVRMWIAIDEDISYDEFFNGHHDTQYGGFAHISMTVRRNA